ncbi:sigma-54 interaction domain-containing protein [Sutcliffiella deserti]|uniref:sigma-54 interaction domain-containing protein n=1 Tax=Sutcliffiella deserti TaxID=2875501 RepID=UPI001CC11FE4|nr:sigma 54-interacting transcriptional regulator [Sutcliffiella deserti]
MVSNPLLSKEMLGAILDGIDEAIHAVDPNGVTIYYNRVASEHDGLKVNEVMGKHILQVFPSLTEHTSTLLRVLQTKKAIYQQNQCFENKNGELVETINTTIPLLLGKEILGALEIAKNYSQVTALANKLIDLQSKLYIKNKLTSKHPLEVSFTLEDFITENADCKLIVEEAKLFASSTLPVIIYGETGTGKEIIAQGIHAASLRSKFPFIAQNCGAIPETLLESILFGTDKGSYTGAVEKAGLFELANGGTLFLDELNSMPLLLQAKLLRVLEDGTFRRVGGITTYKVNVRIITAMNESPEVCVSQKKLREDLFYRLNTCSISLPPLRDRPNDILVLANHFLATLSDQSKEDNQTFKVLSDSVVKKFTSYPWPGNVRELKNAIEFILVKSKERVITEQDIPSKLLHENSSHKEKKPTTLRQAIYETEKQLIEDVLEQTDGNVQKAARLLAIPRQTLQYKIKKIQETE